jgi:aminoglycoside phosphotransferase (APT) family kinase protein
MNLPQTTLNHLPVQNGCAEMQKKRPSAASTLLAESKIQETLAMQWPLSQHNNATLLHGDYWPGNTLWQDGLLTAVIDWEDAKVGDPLLDLAVSRLDISWIFGMDALHIFSQHYQSLRQINYVNLPLWDLCAALRFIRIFGGNLAEAAAYFGAYGRADITEQAILANYNAFIGQAFEGL